MLSKLNILLATVFIISFFQEHVNCSRRHWERCSCTTSSAPFLRENAEELKHMIVALPNCRPGQVLVNNQCYDLWSILHDSRNTIVAPSNCPPDQKLVNGRCQDGWRSSIIMETVPDNWRNFLSKKEYHFKNEDSLLKYPDIENRDVVDVPQQCPIGYKADGLGNCRKEGPP